MTKNKLCINCGIVVDDTKFRDCPDCGSEIFYEGNDDDDDDDENDYDEEDEEEDEEEVENSDSEIAALVSAVQFVNNFIPTKDEELEESGNDEEHEDTEEDTIENDRHSFNLKEYELMEAKILNQ